MYYRVHNRLPQGPALNQIIAVHIPISYPFKIHFNIVLPLTREAPRGLLPSGSLQFYLQAYWWEHTYWKPKSLVLCDSSYTGSIPSAMHLSPAYLFLIEYCDMTAERLE
jgi:hypothetical protein